MNPPRSRTVRRRRPERARMLLAFTIAVCGMACRDPASITGPAVLPETVPSPPSAPESGLWVVRGTVFEHALSGKRPLAGVRLRVLAYVDPSATVIDAVSDANGSYSATVPQTAHFVRVQLASVSAYFAPCPPFAWGRFGPLDVHVVSGSILSTTGVPPSFPGNTQWGDSYSAVISGRVFERTPGGHEPVSGASITMDPQNSPVATLSDANGRYLICSVGNSEIGVTVVAQKEGYVSASVFGLPGLVWDLDFELTRR